MTLEQAREAGKTDPRFNHPLGVFAVMQLPDHTYTYGLEDTTLPKSREEAQSRPVVVERWSNTGWEWQQVLL